MKTLSFVLLVFLCCSCCIVKKPIRGYCAKYEDEDNNVVIECRVWVYPFGYNRPIFFSSDTLRTPEDYRLVKERRDTVNFLCHKKHKFVKL